MIYQFNNLELDTQGYRLTREGNQVPIEPQVFDLLNYLVENRKRLVSRGELFDTIWKDRIVSDTSLSNHIKSARKVIGDDGRKQCCIKTIHGRGYQFIAETLEVINHGSDISRYVAKRSVTNPENLGPFVAVLPFQNMGPDHGQQYFAEGVSEDITTELSRFTDIQVIARHTAFQYNGASLDIRKVFRELNVDYLVEGSVRRAGDKIRVNVQLIESSSAKHVWAEKYDRGLDQIFKIQDEITETVVSTISGQIRRIETDRANARSTKNLRAYDHLLRGLSFHKNGYVSYENFVKASEEFAKAIELDPNFARARAWVVCSRAGTWEPKTDELVIEAIDDAKFALSLDEQESETHRILGSLYLYIRNYQLAGHHYIEAKRLSPNDAHIAVKLGRYYAYVNDDASAMKTVKRAMRLNPLYPGWYWQELGVVYYSMGEFQTAIDMFYKNWEHGSFDLAWIAASFVAMNDMDSAHAVARKAVEIEPRASVLAYTQFETYRDENKHKLLCDRMSRAGIPE